MEPFNTTVGALRKGQVFRLSGVTNRVTSVRRRGDAVEVTMTSRGKTFVHTWPASLVVTKVTGFALKGWRATEPS